MMIDGYTRCVDYDSLEQVFYHDDILSKTKALAFNSMSIAPQIKDAIDVFPIIYWKNL